MVATASRRLGEVMDIDLAGFQLTKGYFLELDHGLMGTFPAIFSETEETVVCLDKELLEEIRKYLPKRPSKITELLVLVNKKERLAFSLRHYDFQHRNDPENLESIDIVLRKNFEFFDEEELESIFEWTPGLL